MMPLDRSAVEHHTSAYQRLTAQLEQERDASRLPEQPSAHEELNDLVIRSRLEEGPSQHQPDADPAP